MSLVKKKGPVAFSLSMLRNIIYYMCRLKLLWVLDKTCIVDWASGLSETFSYVRKLGYIRGTMNNWLVITF